MLKDYLEGTMKLDEFCEQSTIVCQDYIYTRTKVSLLQLRKKSSATSLAEPPNSLRPISRFSSSARMLPSV
jgi:hypothetical protein